MTKTTSPELESNSQLIDERETRCAHDDHGHGDEPIVVRFLRTGSAHQRLLRVGQSSAGCGWCAHNKVL
ncbi:MAG: hypothetical protein H6811_09950 [Phycisphaeraceae bacterium]|nr:hypothetical protein [Phycisphaeraceae bacterium]